MIWNGDLQNIYNEIKKNGGEVRLVGGCVRDHLKNIEAKDFDLATNLESKIVLKIFIQTNLKTLFIKIQYGIVTILSNNKNYDICSLREDMICNGRGAKTQFTENWIKDSQRRDFTINAIYIDINNNLFDYHEGIYDINMGITRFIGIPEKRIQEDKLRILRYFRFLSFLGIKNIDIRSMYYCINNMQHLDVISKDRIRNELFKLLSGPYSHKVIKILIERKKMRYLRLSNLSWDTKDIYKIKFSIKKTIFNLAILIKGSNNFNANQLTTIKNNLNLSKKQFQYLKEMTCFNVKTKFKDFHHYYYLNKLGSEHYKDFIKITVLFTKIRKYNFYYNDIKYSCQKLFPIKGGDILKNNIRKEDIKKTITILKNIWHHHKNSISKEKLLRMLI